MIAEYPTTETLNGGNYFAEGTYATTDVRRGVTRNRAGARLCCLTTDFLLGFRRAVQDETGPAADIVFKSCGHKWGLFMAKRFDEEMTNYYGKPLREFTLAKFQATLSDFFSHHGWGHVNIDLTRHDQGLVLLTMDQPIFASIVKPGERPDQPVDSLMAGIFGGFFATIFEQDLDCVQTKCKARGEDQSLFVIGLATRLAGVAAWQEAGKNHEQILKELVNLRV
jgi:uncharacterized protein